MVPETYFWFSIKLSTEPIENLYRNISIKPAVLIDRYKNGKKIQISKIFPNPSASKKPSFLSSSDIYNDSANLIEDSNFNHSRD